MYFKQNFFLVFSFARVLRRSFAAIDLIIKLVRTGKKHRAFTTFEKAVPRSNLLTFAALLPVPLLIFNLLFPSFVGWDQTLTDVPQFIWFSWKLCVTLDFLIAPRCNLDLETRASDQQKFREFNHHSICDTRHVIESRETVTLKWWRSRVHTLSHVEMCEFRRKID